MDIRTKLEDPLQMDGSPKATKRHKRRKSIHLLCVLCLFVAPLFCFPSCGSISKSAFPSHPASRGRDKCERKRLLSLLHHNAGAGMRKRGDRSEKETNSHCQLMVLMPQHRRKAA